MSWRTIVMVNCIQLGKTLEPWFLKTATENRTDLIDKKPPKIPKAVTYIKTETDPTLTQISQFVDEIRTKSQPLNVCFRDPVMGVIGIIFERIGIMCI